MLGPFATTLSGAVTSAGIDAEREVERALPERGVSGFGVDCDCLGHLTYHEHRDRLSRAVRDPHRLHDSASIPNRFGAGKLNGGTP